jgi:hypothetical protein
LLLLLLQLHFWYSKTLSIPCSSTVRIGVGNPPVVLLRLLRKSYAVSSGPPSMFERSEVSLGPTNESRLAT